MAELKRTFTGGKMDKDTDERIVPNGIYREALNISVATSEDSDVGAAQNILGNIKVGEAIQHSHLDGYFNSETSSWDGDFLYGHENLNEGNNFHIASIVNPQTNMLYRFVHTASDHSGIWMDRIVEFDTSKKINDPWESKEHAVFVDIFKVRTVVVAHEDACSGSGNAVIQVPEGIINQLRWGMVISEPNEDVRGHCTIIDVNYATRKLTLDCIMGELGLNAGDVIWFYGDRNLNFGDHEEGFRNITGINVVDDMIFWTDDFSEPKKIHIERSKDGCDSGKWANLTGRSNRRIDDFNQHTLLIVDDVNPKEEYIDVNGCNIGCNDPEALNYDASVNVVDNSTCIYKMSGCTDYSAYNFDPAANQEDGSCCYISGCMDPAACNYSADICFSDASACIYDGCNGGCTDPTATNYDANADYDDGSCTYPTVWAVVGCECKEVAFIPGQYDDRAECESANADYFSSGCCAGIVIYGCTDPAADNYDPEAPATCDDGSCTYTSTALTLDTPLADYCVTAGSSQTITWTGGDSSWMVRVGLKATWPVDANGETQTTWLTPEEGVSNSVQTLSATMPDPLPVGCCDDNGGSLNIPQNYMFYIDNNPTTGSTTEYDHTDTAFQECGTSAGTFAVEHVSWPGNTKGTNIYSQTDQFIVYAYPKNQAQSVTIECITPDTGDDMIVYGSVVNLAKNTSYDDPKKDQWSIGDLPSTTDWIVTVTDINGFVAVYDNVPTSPGNNAYSLPNSPTPDINGDLHGCLDSGAGCNNSHGGSLGYEVDYQVHGCSIYSNWCKMYDGVGCVNC